MTTSKTYAAKLDENGKPILDENGDKIMELVSETDNGVTEIIPPDWVKLEQDLRYFGDGALFGKAVATASPNPFSIFLKTLENGDKGIASENALAYAFSILGVSWTDEEKGQLNTILTQNNFTIQL